MGQTTTEDSLCGLAYRMCFTRQGRLIDPQVGFLHQATVGRDVVTLGQQHHIARDKLLREELLLLSARTTRAYVGSRRGAPRWLAPPGIPARS